MITLELNIDHLRGRISSLWNSVTDKQLGFNEKKASEARAVAEKQDEEYLSAIKMLNMKFSSAESLRSEIFEEILKEKSLRTSLEIATCCCETERCLSKIEIHFNKTKSVHEQFLLDKKENLTYNQDQLHKFEKLKLAERLKQVQALVQQHCWKTTCDMRQNFVSWLRAHFVIRTEVLQKTETLLSRFHDELLGISSQIDQIVKRCDRDTKLLESRDWMKALIDKDRKKPDRLGQDAGAALSTLDSSHIGSHDSTSTLISVNQRDERNMIKNSRRENRKLLDEGDKEIEEWKGHDAQLSHTFGYLLSYFSIDTS